MRRKSVKKKTRKTKRITAKDYRIVARIDLDKKLTKRDLQEYIRSSTKLLNKAYKTMNEASKRDFDTAVRRIGKGRGKTDILGTHMWSKSKKELELQARLLKSLQQGDGVSNVAKTFENLRVERAYKSYIKSPLGMDISREKYKEVTSVFTKIDKESKKRIKAKMEELQLPAEKIADALRDYGSEQVQTIISDYNTEDLSIETIGDVIIRLSKDFNGTAGELTALVVQELKSMTS